MRALTTAELLEVWERGLPQRPIERALEILCAAHAATSFEELAACSVGERDRLLLTLREWTFGPDLNAVLSCRYCREKLEVNFSTADVLASSKPAAEMKLGVNSFDLRLRPVTSADLLEVLRAPFPSARAALLSRCIVSAQQADEPLPIEQLPDEVIEASLERMAAADPQADIQIAVECPRCGEHQNAPLDIVEFFWSEIEAWAVRILREVHALASAYGWREADILALSPARRQTYLGMVTA